MQCEFCGGAVDAASNKCVACGAVQSAPPPQQAYAPPPVHQHHGAPAAVQHGGGGPAPSVGFGESIKACFGKFADGSGRASPSEYWWFVLFSILLAIPTFGIGLLITAIPSIAVAVRRLHDTGKSGWYYLFSLIPYLGGLIVLILVLQKADPNPNQWG